MKKNQYILLFFLSICGYLFSGNSHNTIVSSVSISSDSKTVASLSYSDLKIWDIESGKLLYKYPFKGRYVKLMPDNKTALVVSDTANLIEIATGKIIRSYFDPKHVLRGVAAVSNNGKLLACNTNTCNILIFDTETGKAISPELKVAWEDYSYVRSISFSSDDKTLLVTESLKKSYWLIDLSDFSTKQELIGASALSIAKNPAFLLVGYIYATGGGTNFTATYLNSGTTLNFEDKHSIYAIACNPINNYIAATGTLGGVTIWDLDKREHKTLKGHKMSVNDVEFSSDGKYLVSCSGNLNKDVSDFTVRLWDPVKKKLIRIFEE